MAVTSTLAETAFWIVINIIINWNLSHIDSEFIHTKIFEERATEIYIRENSFADPDPYAFGPPVFRS